MQVFLSYHTPDRAVALGLKNAIEAALQGVEVFLDQTLRYGHLWQPVLSEAIAQAQAFVILISNRVGDWQRLEYYDARDRKAKDDAFVLLPVIIADRAKGPPANLPGLTQFHWIETTEPTAPDPLAKIVAALEARETAKPPEPWRTINPYRGLVALEEQDADFFFGRNRETAEILGKISAASGRLIALIGNSGVGKSSLVQAGVIGSLKRQRWPEGQHPWPEALSHSRAYAYLTMRPGEAPIDALISEFAALWFPDPTDPRRVDRRREWAERLRSGAARLGDVIRATDDQLRNELALIPPPRVLLYIDQGEELYSRSPAAERKRFSEIVAEGLAGNPQRLIVMTSQRADYFGELQANASLFNLTELISVPPLDTNNLSLVLREPARVLGVGFESDDLVDRIVESAENQPGALPLLADLFTDLWERMRGRGDATLRVSDRREIIQVGAALSRRADRFLAENPGKVDVMRRLFTLRLAHVLREGEPIRSRWQRDPQSADSLAGAEWALVEQLAGPDWRLTVTGEKDGKAFAEVAHEVLLKTWTTLRSWLEAEREFLVWRGELAGRRKDFEDACKTGPRQERKALLMGAPLDAAQKWLAARRSDIEPVDQAFIETSIRADRAVERNRQQWRMAVGVLMVGVIVGLIGWINQSSIADEWRWWTVTRPYADAWFHRYVLSAGKERALKPGDPFKECAPQHCPEMIVVPAGSFRMGSPASQSQAAGDGSEMPEHTVTISKPFAVSKYELTFTDWDACVAGGGCNGYKPYDAGWGRGRQPVILVSWSDAQRYVAWLSEVTQKPYRLLSESEYEYASRARTSTAYPWGNDIKLNGVAVANCEGCGSQWDGKQPAPVGSFPPNKFGLYDMVGNLWEWTEDCWHGDYNEASTASMGTDGGECSNRAVRGGSWHDTPNDLRSAKRGWGSTVNRDIYLGFRVARTLVAP